MAAIATPASKLEWDEVAADLAAAQALTFKLYPDGSVGGMPLPGVTVSGAASPFACSVPFPAFTPGNHTIQLTATNVAGESTRSAVFPFSFVVVPAAPVNLRIT